MLKLIRDLLMKVVNDIDSGNCNYNEEQLNETFELINKLTVPEAKLSKYQAYHYLNISRATFDNWIKLGKIPAGKKQQGFTEKYWLKKELDEIKDKKLLN